MSLNEANKALVNKFTTFIRGKRERLLADCGLEEEEFKSDRLSDDGAIYNQGDVHEMLDAYHAQITGIVRDRVEALTNLSAVYISQMLLEAEQLGATLEPTDISLLDDQLNSEALGAMLARGAAPQPPVKKAPLPTIQAAAPDPALAQKNQELEETNMQLNERYRAMQMQVSELLKERSSLSGELEKVKANFQVLMQTSPESATSREIENSLTETQALLDAKKAENDQMRKELNQRLGDSWQFKELKAIVKKKSEEVKQLRATLASAGIPVPGAGGGVELTADDD